MCRYLSSQTYTPWPDTTQKNQKGCCIPTGSRVHAGKARTIGENNSKCRRYLQQKTGKRNNRRIRNFLEVLSSKKRQTIFTSHERSRSHATNTISAWNFLMMESGKNIFQSYFLETWRSYEFYGANDISFPMRGPIFPSSAV